MLRISLLTKILFCDNFYKGHSIKKMNIAKGAGNRKQFTDATFFKKINSDRSFHVTEDCQHDLLY